MAKKTEMTDESTEITQLENEPGKTSENIPAAEAPVHVESPVLESLSELAARHRIPGWQQAAVERLMGWAEGKKVSESDYLAALGTLSTRPLGGGRA